MDIYTTNCIHYQVCQRSGCHNKCQCFEERPQLTDEQIEQIIDLLETEWGYEGIREDVSRILRGGRE